MGVQDLSYPLPVSVIAEMLGVAPGHRPRFKRWASDGLAGVVGRFASPAEGERAQKSGEELQDYFVDSPFTSCWFLIDADGDGHSDACDADDDNDG